MKSRFTRRAATAAIATLLLAACSDDDDAAATAPPHDGARILAKGDDIDFVGSGGLADQTMDIEAVEEAGKVTGEASFEPHGSVVALSCVDADSDGVVLIGGRFTKVPDDGDERVGTWVTVVIREGDPDRAFTWHADVGTDTCAEAFAEVRELDLGPDSTDYAEVEDGDDIETG